MADFFTGVENAVRSALEFFPGEDNIIASHNEWRMHYENGVRVYRYICNSCNSWTMNYGYEPWEDDNGSLICIACIGRCQEWRREVGLLDAGSF